MSAEAKEHDAKVFKELYRKQFGREWRVSDPIVLNFFGEMIGYAHDTYPEGEETIGLKIVDGKLEMVSRSFNFNEVQDYETGED
jgi:hypothetical protein